MRRTRSRWWVTPRLNQAKVAVVIRWSFTESSSRERSTEADEKRLGDAAGGSERVEVDAG
jgi:hypothetical protein